MGDQWISTVEGPVTKHSAKPERFYELIEEYFPNLPKIELNARNARAGWDAWGNEAPVESCDETTGEITDTTQPAPDNLDIPQFLKREQTEATV
jgi:N6-adenosine-specific RNA methylase IME4